MRRPTVRGLNLLAAVALLTTTSVAVASPPPDDLELHISKKRTTTLTGLSPQIQEAAVRRARSRPGAPKVAARTGSPQAGPTDADLWDTCLQWFITWDEDENGNPIMGTFYLHCDDSTIFLG